MSFLKILDLEIKPLASSPHDLQPMRVGYNDFTGYSLLIGVGLQPGSFEFSYSQHGAFAKCINSIYMGVIFK